MSVMKKSVQEKIIDLLFLLAGCSICAVFVFKARFIYSADGDSAPSTYSFYLQVARSLHNHELPLWNSYICGGVPNVSIPVTKALYPINWILCMLFYDRSTQMVSYSIIYVSLFIHIALYFVGLFFLLKKIGTSAFGAFVISMCSFFSFSIFKICGWAIFFDAFCWFPLIVLNVINLYESKSKQRIVKYIIILALLFGMEALLSISQALFVIVFLVICLFFAYTKKNIKFYISNGTKLASAGMLGVLIGAPTALSLLSFVKDSARYADDGWVFGGEKLDYSKFILHICTLNDAEKFFNVVPRNSWMSVGGVILIFMVIGLFSNCIKKREVQSWATFSFCILWLHMIGFLIADFIYYIPLVNVLRESFMYACYMNFFATVLAAMGLGCIEKVIKEQELLSEALKNWKSVYLIIIILLIYNILPHRTSGLEGKMYVLLVAYVVFLLVAVLLGITKFRSKFRWTIWGFRFVILFCVVVNFYFFNTFNAQLNNYNEQEVVSLVHNKLAELDDVFFEICADDKLSRIEDLGRSSHPDNLGSVLGFREASGYFNPLPKQAAYVNSFDLSKKSEVLNIRFFLVNSNSDPNFIAYIEELFADKLIKKTEYEIFTKYGSEEKELIYVYEVKTLGNAWLVSKSEILANVEDEQIVNYLNGEAIDFSNIAYVTENSISEETKTKVSQLSPEPFEYSIDNVKYDENKITYEVSSNIEAILVSSEYYDEDWKVYVNGKKSDLLCANYCNRAVIVPTGTSTVEFVYRPASVYTGFVLQFLGIIILVCLFVYCCKLKKKAIVKR